MTLPRDEVLVGIAEEFSAFTDLLETVGDDQLDARTRCEGWTVRDVTAHVVGTVVDVAAGRVEGQGQPATTARQARERTGRTVAELTAELTAALPRLDALLDALPAGAWDDPWAGGPAGTLGFAVEALWYDAYVHADDVRAALRLPSRRGPGLRCAVHHVAGYLEQQGRLHLTLALDEIEPIVVGNGGELVGGDPLHFVLATTGREDPRTVGLPASANVYADQSAKRSSAEGRTSGAGPARQRS
jgi:uncharacterized protein (TIGR03083 family)